MEKRTASDLVKDMTSKGASWLSILAVARATRGGNWYAEVTEILQADGRMPRDREEIAAAAIKVKANLDKIKEEASKPDPNRPRRSGTSPKTGPATLEPEPSPAR